MGQVTASPFVFCYISGAVPSGVLDKAQWTQTLTRTAANPSQNSAANVIQLQENSMPPEPSKSLTVVLLIPSVKTIRYCSSLQSGFVIYIKF